MGCWESDGEDDDVEEDAEDAPVADDALAEGDGASLLQKWRNLQIAKKTVSGNALCYEYVVVHWISVPIQMYLW